MKVGPGRSAAAREGPRAGRRWADRCGVALAAALVLGSGLRWGEARGRPEPERLVAAAGETLPAAADTSPAARDALPTPASAARLPTLLLVFQAGDCPSHGWLLDAWTALHDRSAVRALAVGLGFPRDTSAARRLAEEAGLRLPFRPDLARSAERLMLGLGFRRTPVTLLLDPAGRVRLALPAPDGAAAGEAWVRAVEEHANRLRAEGGGRDVPPAPGARG